MPQADAGLLDAVCRRDPRALARAISLVEHDRPDGRRLLTALHPRTGRARVIGVTGPPGAGKSTLVDRLVGAWRERGETVAVVAVDPTSPLSGGALLGDRFHMGTHADDPGVFVRSMASRGRQGGLSVATDPVVRLLDGAGFAVVVVETVGAGQDDVAVAAVADLTVLVVPPDAGDDVQAMKAGLMEIADVFVVNKADLAGADRMASSIEATMALVEGSVRRSVVQTIATRAAGIDDVMAAIERTWAGLSARIGARRLARSATRAAADPLVGAPSQGSAGFRLDHVGIAVADAEPLAARLSELFALVADAPEDVGDHRVRFLPAGGVSLELVEPRSAGAAVAGFLARRGTALHHLCFEVDDLVRTAGVLRERGVRFIDDRPRPGAHGTHVMFIHPSSAGGLLVELRGRAAPTRVDGSSVTPGDTP